jgi:hypothetical protein
MTKKQIQELWDLVGPDIMFRGPLWANDPMANAAKEAARQKPAVVLSRDTCGRTPAKRVYIASSKRNPFYSGVVIRAREAGYKVHDWSDPPFHWGAVDPNYQDWSLDKYVAALRRSAGRDHFDAYMRAIAECDACVALLPAGTDTHAEALTACMVGKPIGDLLRRRPPATRAHPLPI